MFSHKVKIVRNYKSKDEKILEDVSAQIQPDISFFDNRVDIKRGDYVFVPDLDEPLIVTRVEVRPRGRGVYIKEIKFITESEFLGKQHKSGIGVQEEFSRVIQLNNVSASIYLQVIGASIENSDDIPLKQKKSLIKKVKELENDSYIESLSTNLSLSEEKLKNFNLMISY